MKKPTITLTVCLLLFGTALTMLTCNPEPIDHPVPTTPETDSVVTPVDDDDCEPQCDSCPPNYRMENGVFQYFKEPVVIQGINSNPMFQDTVHAIFMSDLIENDTIGFLNEEDIPECMRKEDPVHVRLCFVTPLGFGYKKTMIFYCIEKI